ncbi:transposase [Streptomyces sp. NPDC059544]|uniref:transposase n=1 Tax=Streptomyces sp. NPDC059544 TaxID=3346861 RepID=UPI0036AB426D
MTAANVHDRDAAAPLLERLRGLNFSVRLVTADGGHAGRLVDWAAENLHLTLEIVKRSDDTTGFVVLPRSWVVDRTPSWLMRPRRLVRDNETLPATHEAMVLWSMTMLMSSRLAGAALAPSAGRRPERMNTPGRVWSAQPRSTRRFAFDRSPSTFAGTPRGPEPQPAAGTACPSRPAADSSKDMIRW